jgi:GTP cyclohydrolase II
MAKLQAYELQDVGIDTVEANHALGFKADCRDFSLPAAILHDLDVRRVRLLTNNPGKARALSDAGIEVVARIPCEAAPSQHSFAYLRTKKEKMGHVLNLQQHESMAQINDPRAMRSHKLEELPAVGAKPALAGGGDGSRAVDVAWRARGIEVQL